VVQRVFEQNPGIDTEGIAFALFVARMNNEMAETVGVRLKAGSLTDFNNSIF
jgi:hypothetical protein